MNTKENNGIIQPYLFFNGRCEEAIEFYKHALGAEVLMLVRFKDCPEPGMIAPGTALDKIMHGRIRVGKSVILVSDGRCAGKPVFEGFSLSLIALTEAEADRFFNGLAEGGKIVMPLGKTFFSPRFGMVEDRFGVEWMILVE